MPDDKPRNIVIPTYLFVIMREAIRCAEEDTRKDDRVLHDTTRVAILSASDAINKWQDARIAGRR